jgi:hypothetical protein
MNKKKKEKKNATRIMAVNHTSIAYLARKAAIVNGVGVAKASPRYHGGLCQTVPLTLDWRGRPVDRRERNNESGRLHTSTHRISCEMILLSRHFANVQMERSPHII